MTGFEGVVPALGEALTKRGYSLLTPVQQDMLAPEISGADALVSAQTGSGKTVAFGMTLAPTLLEAADRFSYAKVPLALVVAPTRELALQVKRELEWLYEMTGASFASCVGGMDMRVERQVLWRGVHIVVGTPGRLRDHIERGSLNMSGLKAVVLDEADEMLDLGFREDLEFILNSAPPERRTLMFSATVPRTIANLAKRYQRNAVRVTTSAEQKQHVDIEYRALTVAPNDRENAIINVLRYYEAKSAIVFCATRAGVNRMTSRFTNRGFSVVALSGELSQAERTHALQAMRDGRARVCIATDVAARGLDLPNLELVIHADIPENSQALLHRSGRTGRAGRKGVSVLIVPHNHRRRTERLFQDAHIDAAWAKPPSVDEIVERDDVRLLEDPVLMEPLGDGETPFVQEILARHSAEQIAAAFVRLYRAGQSAPEDLLDHAPSEGRGGRDSQSEGRVARGARRESRDDFSDGVWFSLSVGHKQSAEPRWLLPMLYRVGNVAKGEIGAIKVYNSETHVEIAPGSVDRFLQAVGPDGTVEKDITVTRMEGVPKALDEKRDQPYAKKKRFGDHKSGARGKPSQNRKFDPADRKSEPRERKFEPNDRKFEPKAGETPAEENPRARPTTTLKSRSTPFGKPAGKAPGKSWSKPGGRVENRAEGRSEGKPENKPWSKPGGKSKKPYVSKFAKNGAKPGAKVGSKAGPKSGPKGRAPDASGFSPRKRTRPGNTD